MSSGALNLGTGLQRNSTGAQSQDIHREALRSGAAPKLQRKSARAAIQQTGAAQFGNSPGHFTGESQDVHKGPSLSGSPKLQRRSIRSTAQQAAVTELASNSVQLTGKTRGYETVADVMTTKVITVSPEATVLEALDLIVKHRITGMPVVGKDGKVVGVVSDYDLLALDLSDWFSQGMFPELDQSWQAFKEVQSLMTKVEGKTVEDVMTTDPFVIRPSTSLDLAARLLLESKIRRLPVLDNEGKLVGVISRRNIIVAALADRRLDKGAFDIVGQLL